MATLARPITLAALGKRFSRLRTFGLETVAVIFIPSYCVYRGLIPSGIVARARTYSEMSDAIGVFIVIVIVGSIMSIDRRMLLPGLARISVPLILGSIFAAAAGTLIGTLLGMAAFDALFRVVLPIMGGGVTAGALPLSIGYAKVMGAPQGQTLALILPSVILGNLAAIVFAGIFNFFYRRRSDESSRHARPASLFSRADAALIAPADGSMTGVDFRGACAAAALMLAMYLAGLAASRSLGLPSPLTVLVLTALLHISNALTPRLRMAVLSVYRFCISTCTFPLLFLVGLLMTPWEKLVAGFGAVNLITIFATVGVLSMSGYVISRRLGLHPIEGAIITVTRAAMGGTGDIAVLTAARRLELMPFAQIATRIGGAVTVAAALIAIQQWQQ